MTTNMQFAHYTSWKINHSAYPIKCETTWEESNYWKQKLIQEHTLEDADVVANLCAVMPQLRAILTPLYEIINHGKYASELLKEFVFEGVRQDKFPRLPSRRQCIFLLAPEDHISAIQNFGFSTERPTAVAIEVANPEAVFLADASLLNCGTLKHHELKVQAEKYWNGERSSKPLLEYLYVGEFTIVGRL